MEQNGGCRPADSIEQGKHFDAQAFVRGGKGCVGNLLDKIRRITLHEALMRGVFQ